MRSITKSSCIFFLIAAGLVVTVAQIRQPAWASTPYHYTSCFVDSDGDGIADCYETNTGIYVNATNTGTSPTNVDTDGDGLSDGDEVYGTQDGLNLPAFGVNPLHKDILLEYDWMEDSSECLEGQHSHKPTQAMADIVAQMFSNAPVSNPDGTQGIHVFQDVHYGPVNNPNFASNRIPDADGWISGHINTPNGDYQTYETAYFPANRRGYFHYVIFAHRFDGDPSASGEGTVGGHEMLVTLACDYDNTNKVAFTIAHELGHNLGLQHGGDEYCNYKPNYNSIMNYQYQFYGVDTCGLQDTGIPDFSRGTRRFLMETNLYEPDGVCTLADNPYGPTPIDWNRSGSIDTAHFARRVRPYSDASCPGGAGQFAYDPEGLHDYNDWANIALSSVLHRSSTTETCAPIDM